jgi:hypothetical protein
VSEIDLRSREFIQAITKLRKRAERELDDDKLEGVLVESDLSHRTETSDTQLILGRRGTGKTHLMRVFAYRRQQRGEVAKYVDCTKLGSGIANDDPIISSRKYFTALLNEILNFLFDKVVNLELPDIGVAERVEKSIYALLPFTEWKDVDGEPTFNYRQITETLSAVLKDLETVCKVRNDELNDEP